MTVTAILAGIYRRMSTPDRCRFLLTLLLSAWWVSYCHLGYAFGAPPAWVATLLWAMTGVVVARLAILAFLVPFVVHQIRRAAIDVKIRPRLR